MHTPDVERLKSVKTLPSLIAYLRDELAWPIEAEDIEDVFFDYDPADLGFTCEHAAKIKEIKQLRPLDGKQPWGIFWVNFDKKALPVVMLRRILSHLVVKNRASANKATQRAWHMNDLLFISAYGDDSDRAITFAHFAHESETKDDLPVLKVLGWDGGDTVLHLADAHRTLTEQLRWPVDPRDLAAWRTQWGQAFTLRNREVISTTEDLVEELAHLAVAIRKTAEKILPRETERGPMKRLYAAFKTALIHDLTEEDFADVIAQTISYGLLAARFSQAEKISVQNLVDMIPKTNPFLRGLLEMLLDAAGRKKGAFDFDELGIQDVVKLLNHANAEAVKADFGNRTHNEDPVIHFYEHFLHAYDRQKKVQRGAFYTPTPVVSYIVRSVHELLQTEFGLADGLADTTTWGEMVKRNKDLKIPDGAKSGDPFVLILDPATGTATFLVEVIEVIFTYLKKKWTDLGKKPAEICRLWNEYVPTNLLPRLYGYELMMAPYTIAHMKLALKLQEINARLGQPDFQFMYTDRAHIYLTNSLEPAVDDKQGTLEGVFPALAHEAAAVNLVKKDKRFTVVIGNPPYSNFGQLNRIPFILDLLEDYKRGLEERKINLDDDFIKFVRFSHHLLDKTGAGVFGMITNNSFLDGITHRQMRQRLGCSYQRIAILNLHGSATLGETCSDGSVDENVFDIRQGVAITFCVKCNFSVQYALELEYADLFGTRLSKYNTLNGIIVNTSAGASLPFLAPYFFFVPKDFGNQDEYERGISLKEVFQENNTGIQTKRDSLTIQFDRAQLRQALNDLMSLSESVLRARYELPEDGRDWQVSSAKADVGRKIDDERIQRILYRPFDWRWTYFTGRTKGFLAYPRRETSKHMLQHNLALVTLRINGSGDEFVMMATDCLIEKGSLPRGNYSFFPLYLYSDNHETQATFRLHGERQLNFSPSFTHTICTILGLLTKGSSCLPAGLTPEDIFHYIYAVFHSPTYRARYAEFLKIDFPRLPLTANVDLFRALAKLGGELVALHLMESPKLDKHITKWIGGKNAEVEKIAYSDDTVWTDKAQSTGFTGVPKSVWNFHIGGYQVCEKWLKDRKGRTLTKDDIEHYQRIIIALSETIRLMAEIDQVIEKHGGWPGAFVTEKPVETQVSMPVGRRASSKKSQCEPEFL